LDARNLFKRILLGLFPPPFSFREF
jgi:hypothetical protein